MVGYVYDTGTVGLWNYNCRQATVAHENNKFPTGNVEMIVKGTMIWGDEVRRRDQSDIRIQQIINRTNPTMLILSIRISIQTEIAY